MPVEILPEGNPDWIEYSTRAGILFLDIDPFWKTKTGGNPNLATMYRGGLGFFDRSTDGGRTWSTIIPSTDPPWFVAGDEMWDTVWNTNEPVPRPANGEPSYDNQITAPTPGLLRYQSYNGSSARSGEHVVLCAYTKADSAGYLNQVDFNNELELGWILYTFDDWVTHGWQQILLNIALGKSTPTLGSTTTIRSEAASISDGPYTVKVGTGKFAVFWRDASGVFCANITESGGTFSVSGTSAASSTALISADMFADGAGHVFKGGIVLEMDGAERRFKATAQEWDCSGSTPSFVGITESAFLPDFTPSEDTFLLAGKSGFYLTPAGKLAYLYGAYDLDTLEELEKRKWYWFYFNTSTDTFSTPVELHNGTAEADDIPERIQVSCFVIDGGDKVAVSYIERQNWTNRSQDDYFGSTFIMTIGTWAKEDEDEWLNEIDASLGYEQGVLDSKVWSNNRFCFYHTFNNTVREARMYTFATSPDTLTFIPHNDTFDAGDRGGVCLRDDPVGDIGYVHTNMHWADPSIFPDNSVEISEDQLLVRAAFGDLSKYAHITEPFFDTTWKLDARVVTIPPKPPDDMHSRYLITTLAYGASGDFVWVAGHDYAGFGGGPDGMETMVDRFQRNPSHLPANSIGYADQFATGWQWSSFDDGYTKTELDNGDTYVAIRSWFGETNGILFFGLTYGVSDPSEPTQCWGWRSAGFFEIWSVSAFTDPCRWFIDISGRLYAVAEAGSGLKLYEAKATMISNGDNMIFVSNITLDDANHSNIMALDGRDDTIVVAGGSADLVMVVAAAPPWTSWFNLTLSHRNDRGITGMVVMD